jgi:hypothetical protein
MDITIRRIELASAKVKRKADAVFAAQDLATALDAWEDFLNSAGRFYTKMRAAAVGKPKLWAWFTSKLDERRDDPFLQYMHQARNADVHRLEESVVLHGRVGFRAVGGSIAFFGGSIDSETGINFDWKPLTPGARMENFIEDARLLLTDVTNSGRTYAVPKTHLGNDLGELTIFDATQLMVAYLDSMLSDFNSRRL